MFSFLKKDTVESVREKLYKMYQKGITLFPEEYFCLYLWYREEPLLNLAVQAKHARALRFMYQKTHDINYLRMAADEGVCDVASVSELCQYYWHNTDYANYWKYITKSYDGFNMSPYNEFAQAYREGLGVEVNPDIAAFFEYIQNPTSSTPQEAERLLQRVLSSDNLYVQYCAIQSLQNSNKEEYLRLLKQLADQGYQLAKETYISYTFTPNRFKTFEQEFQDASPSQKIQMYITESVPASEQVLQTLLKTLENDYLLEVYEVLDIFPEDYEPEEYKDVCENLGLEPNSEGHQIDVLLTPTYSIELETGTGKPILREYNITSSFHYRYANIAADLLEKLGYDSILARFYRLFATHWEMTAF